MSTTRQPFSLYRFLFQTLDPVHVGVGGYRLGRVDLPIAREPGTNLPKIPGTGLSGAARHYAAIRAGKLRCAGQGGDEEGGARGHCGEVDKCPICYTFGTLKNGAVSGCARIFDARLLLFPVATFRGPVWVTSPRTLADFGLEGIEPPSSGKVRVVKDLLGEGSAETKGTKPLNLGWLMVEVEEKEFIPIQDQDARGNRKDSDNKGKNGNNDCPPKPVTDLFKQLPDYVRRRLVLVGDDLFGTVVNSNLEVRTSVSINPETGAAKEGALFTYEALPRAAFLWVDVIEEHKVPADDGAGGGQTRTPFPWPKKDSEEAGKAYVQPESWKSALDVVRAGFEYFEFLGVGGMATRGFGRLKQLACREVTPRW
ncbi:CRISPR-associated RAMP protein, Cmr4 family [Ammonifex degensii KC4]|uniref:CRISPR-associated RAMP protein, Cmr4 family n=1 Tax=Ammonifex degensii (strain DSM 10501 / KC4) TaxID=429009 RepID=C9RCH1_AMMDK|nr:type III-B CRISPR module RAMP protein Cmr4 [Ammonifex degensii]ACX51948.1 CRISPR-associated RAMP protein, Cmr4 family [Ammonifex degensii KC4]